jgi:2-oxoglutarate/2-oxoacid ferredoxin oxidoreductase subunit beta
MPRPFDAANPRKGGAFRSIESKNNDGTPGDAARHDPTDGLAAYKLATEPWPGPFGIFYEVKRPTKNRLEADLIARARELTKGAADLDLLQASFARLR